MIIQGDARSLDLARFDRYGVIVADPPWWYAEQRKTRLDRRSSRGIGACHHYSQMRTEEICAMPAVALAADRCHLYLWATCPLLPDAMRVMDAWGFTWATIAFVWVKMNKGAWRRAQEQASQRSMFAVTDNQVSAFMENLAWFGPGFYTGSNVELVLLGRRGQPFRHVKGHKASQVVFSTHGERHSQKPEEVQDRIEWMYPHAGPYLELFGRRDRAGWDVFGDGVRGSLDGLPLFEGGEHGDRAKIDGC